MNFPAVTNPKHNAAPTFGGSLAFLVPSMAPFVCREHPVVNIFEVDTPASADLQARDIAALQKTVEHLRWNLQVFRKLPNAHLGSRVHPHSLSCTTRRA